MRKDWIVSKEGGGYLVKTVSGFTPENALTLLPNNIDRKDYMFFVLEQVTDPITGGVGYNVSIDQGAKDAYELEDNKKKDKSNKRKLKKEEIEQEASTAFGKKLSDALIDIELYKQMAQDSDAFKNPGIIVAVTVQGYTMGETLSNAADIGDYANEMLDRNKQFWKFKAKKDKELQDELDAIDNE